MRLQYKMSVCRSVHLSCLSVCLSVCLSECLSVSVSVFCALVCSIIVFGQSVQDVYLLSTVILSLQAKSILGEMRVRCNAIKQELESNIQLYKDSVKHSRTVEKQIQVSQTALTVLERVY